MKLIVGLGNPGVEYNNTRHNIGFMCLDELAKYYNLEFKHNKFSGLYDKIEIKDEKVIFLKPQKYMNLSGEVVRDYVNFFKIDVKDVLIICDDLDTDVGSIRLRYKGSSGGHNGLKNIENNLSTTEYKRIKIGISNNKLIDTKDYVLGKFNKDELDKINNILKDIPSIIDDFLIMSFENLMNKYNK